MRTAIISDIHANYPALMKVLEDARAERVDNFIFLGDYFYDFPFANEVVQVLKGMENAHIIKGNAERIIKDCREKSIEFFKKNPDEIKNHPRAGWHYIFTELTQETYDYLNDLENELYIQLSPSALVYAAHESPVYEESPKGRPPNHICCKNLVFRQAMLEKPFTHEEFLVEYNKFINSDVCIPYIKNIDANIIVYGHNHIQSYAYCGNKLIINPGSCGLPRDFDNKAPYTILEETKNGFNVIERRVEYDIEGLIRHTKTSVLYERNRIISELNFLDIRNGRNNLPILLDIATEIAVSKNEEIGDFFNVSFSNATWAEAGERFITQYGV